jgi:hypothetical protein
MESNLKKRERKRWMYFTLLTGGNTSHCSFGGENQGTITHNTKPLDVCRNTSTTLERSRGPQHTTLKALDFCRTMSSNQQPTHEQNNPGKGGAEERGPPQLLWRTRTTPQLDHHMSLSPFLLSLCHTCGRAKVKRKQLSYYHLQLFPTNTLSCLLLFSANSPIQDLSYVCTQHGIHHARLGAIWTPFPPQ